MIIKSKPYWLIILLEKKKKKILPEANNSVPTFAHQYPVFASDIYTIQTPANKPEVYY